MDSELVSYLDRVVERLRDYDAVWLIGSAATGTYVRGVSDVDVIALAASPLSEDEKRAIASDLSHERLPCPARKLELSVYTRAQLEHPAADIQPELNLNTGPGEHSVEPAEPFWFLLDLAMAREHGRALHGPGPGEVVGEVPRALVMGALRESLAWHAREEPASRNAVTNAYRGLRWAEEGVWSTKASAERWGRQRLPDVAPENVLEKVQRILEI